MRPLRRTNLFTLQVLDRFDPTPPVDVERAEAEEAGANHGQADDVGVLARHLSRELGEGQFGDVKLAVGCEASEALVVAQVEPIVVDALGRNDAMAKISKVIVVRSRNRQIELRHASFPLPPVRRGS